MPISKKTLLQPLLYASILISATSLASRFLGLMRDRLLAGQFGAGDQLDIYYASFRIPDFIFNLLILGALNSAFIPVFKNYLSKKQTDKAWYTANNLINIVIVTVVSICLIIYLFANPITELIAPGFDSEKISTTANLTRIMLLSPIFFSLSSITGGILNSFQRFLSYSLAPIFYNLGIIFGIIYLVPHFGVMGLGYGVIIGAGLNLLIQIPETILTGYRYQTILNFRDPNIIHIFHLMIPTTISLAISQINLTVDNIIASTLQSGSIAVLNFASNIHSLPFGIFAIAICTAVFPSLVEYVTTKKYDLFSLQINKSIRQILFVIIPISIFMFIFRAQIVRLLLGTGSFGWEDTRLTLTTLGFFAISLPFQSIIPLLVRSFYAHQNTTAPLFSSSISMIANIFFSILFSKYLGVSGLALSFTIASIINLIITYSLLIKYVPKFSININSTLIKIIISASLAGITSFYSLRIFEIPFDNTSFVGLFLQTSCSSIIGIGTYLLMSYIFKIEELYYLLKIIKPKSIK